MINDYRVTNYCPQFENLQTRKSSVHDLVHQDYPKSIDMHKYISNNSFPYKLFFLKIYNYKCSYCGTSMDIITKETFEIDHFIYEKSFPSKAKAGYIENLVLACHSCNNKKNSFHIVESYRMLLHPDNDSIRSVFIRDESFYITISETYKEDETVKAFHKRLGLGEEIRRLDYLLMSMIGLQRKVTGKPEMYTELGQAIDQLRRKRNIV